MAVALRGSCAHVRIGVLTNSTGRGELARALLRMDPAESPSERDENDALGELTNVITGHVKVVMSTIDGTMRIGLPAHVNTDAFLESSEQITLRVSFGGVPAALVVTMLVP